MIRSHRPFVIALVGLMAALTFWLDQVSRWTPGEQQLDPNKPEFVAEHFTATRFGPQGLLLDRLTATRMWQYPDKHEMYFEAPLLKVFDNGVMQYQIQGEVGRYDTKTKIALYDKKATLFKPATAKDPEITMDTSALWADTAKGLARSSAPVTVHYGQSVVNSVGFSYDQKAGLVTLHSQAKATYVKP
ncbi:LPS export ABC transporter periplasmic protein LptC [Crenobacter sp. SG2303]|uniref:LPS export ABC transporter periplasmic protein LptC n=1 Tax=Crenobacter oryzisoli TaxID=3056844 RepID=A0ABT7XUN2_9NEIS|nr:MULTISPECIES: LPS export ABC transporter periplasmic protein LptC [unclassified Crenobacter]MDN0077502.1 LPS export ABC transporter periplasmic protein LptC [Crenobacter sp. SG2303]MDN0081868.1 LPS export ABC transporter periplasmic protein LptC [Crenobacter sp. SG2305]